MDVTVEPGLGPYVVFTAWHCAACEVQGRSEEADATCWNCGGQVTVTARPSIRVDDIG